MSDRVASAVERARLAFKFNLSQNPPKREAKGAFLVTVLAPHPKPQSRCSVSRRHSFIRSFITSFPRIALHSNRSSLSSSFESLLGSLFVLHFQGQTPVESTVLLLKLPPRPSVALTCNPHPNGSVRPPRYPPSTDPRTLDIHLFHPPSALVSSASINILVAVNPPSSYSFQRISNPEQRSSGTSLTSHHTACSTPNTESFRPQLHPIPFPTNQPQPDSEDRIPCRKACVSNFPFDFRYGFAHSIN